MGNSNLLSGPDIHVMFTKEKVRKCLQNVCKFCQYLSHSICNNRAVTDYIFFPCSFVFGETVRIGTGTL